MNEDLFNIINDVFDNNDLEGDDLYDNTIYEEIKMMVLEIYSQINPITNSSDVSDVEQQINNLLYQRQNIVKDPIYCESDLLYLEAKIKHLAQIPQPEQRSEEWYIFRNNRLTASDFYSVMDGGAISRRNDLIMKKCGAEMPFLTNPAILHGVKFEDMAVKIYEKQNKLKVNEYGCLPHSTIPFFGASPDGIVSYESENKNYVGRMLEIKCPKSRKITGIIPDGYFAQIQGQLEVCDLEYCDYLECDFQMYSSKDDFFEDDIREKGVIVELYDTKLNKTLYNYATDENIKSYDLFKPWEDSIVSKIYDNDDLEYLTTVYWYLNKLNVVLVKRDRNYFTKNYINIKKFWDDVLKYREIGIDTLRKNKKTNYKPYKEKELNFLD
jgi:putative phage-type endonuclease